MTSEAVDAAHPARRAVRLLEANGTFSEALEYVEQARDISTPSMIASATRAAPQRPAGRWTFQIVEVFDQGYYAPFTRLEREVRE